MTTALIVDGKPRPLLHRFSDIRAIVSLDGAAVLVDVSPTGWTLSGDPASVDELHVLQALIAGQLDTTVVTVTPPEES